MSAQARSTVVSRLAARVDARAVRAYLVGDLVAVLAFVLAGELRHGIDPMAQPLHVAGTALPFLVGWALAAPVVGAYAARTLDSRRSAVSLAVGAWVGAVALGQGLRATPWFHGDAAPAFVLVSLVVGGVLLAAWRGSRSLIVG
jgi:hypothetical protein